MFFRILQRDLRRKKTMNVVLLLFVILATMFVASGVNNVVTVMNGTDYYLDKAGVGDYCLLAKMSDGQSVMEKVLADEPAVRDYRIENVIMGELENIHLSGGKEPETRNNILFFQPVKDSAISFFDMNNEEILPPEQGHAYITCDLMEKNNLKPGDRLELEFGDVKITVIIDGRAKDAVLGSKFLGNVRFLLNEKDMQRLLEDENTRLHYQGQVAYVETDEISAVAAVAGTIPGLLFDGVRSTIKKLYIMEMLVAFIVLLLSVCLMLVAFVILKFTITFTIAEEFREIGVMKAIGITGARIRSLYIVKYLMMAVIGAMIGFAASIPFGKFLMKSATENMVLGNDAGLLTNLLGAVIVTFFIVLSAWFSTGKVKKMSPIDAVRAGQTGERYKKKTIYRIGRSHVSADLYLAVNDVVSSPGRFATIVIPFLICTLFVLMLVNTTATMKSPNLVHTFAPERDLYLEDMPGATQFMEGSSRSEVEAYIREKEEKLAENGMPSVLGVDVQYKYMLTYQGKDYTLTCYQGIGVNVSDFTYMEGSVPQNKNEIALTLQTSEVIGAKIGDTVTIDYGEEKRDCIVTAYFQSMNQLGEGIRLHDDAPTDFSHISGLNAFQLEFTDEPSEREIEERKDEVKNLLGARKVMNATEFCISCLGVVDTMEAVQYLLLGITLVVVLLVTILMERSFIADERSQIAIMKAIGFRNRDVIGWHTCRFGLVGLISVVLAALASIPMTHLCITPIFRTMGAVKINYNIDPLQIFLLYPGIIFASTVVTAWGCALYTKTITSRDTANIE